MRTIHIIAAARPNFMKVAPLFHALKKTDWADPKIVHTGQHYDFNMADAFFRDLKLPAPHIHLGIGSGTHAQQTGNVMIAYEKVLMDHRPHLVVVVGDVNSTLAATLAAVKLGIRVAHLEAGLRSFDRTMPEEVNRVATDALADILWTPSPDGDANLLREGVAKEKIEFVGNIMIDSLRMVMPAIEAERTFEKQGLEKGRYGVVTLHRPANVDDPATLASICRALKTISQRLPLVFPVHPRTEKNLKTFALREALETAPGIHLSEPLSYKAFMNLLIHCGAAITDSGGLQEETTYLGIPCLTVRPNTERPITVRQGTNRLCAPENLAAAFETCLSTRKAAAEPPDRWDGRTAARIVDSIYRRMVADSKTMDNNPLNPF